MVFHVGFVVAFGAFPGKAALDVFTDDDPFVMNLQTPEERATRRLVETGAPTAEPSTDTDLISTENTQAQAPEDVTGDAAQAGLEEESDFDRLAKLPPAEPVESTPPPGPEPIEERPVSPESSEALAPEPQTEPAEESATELAASDSILVAEGPEPDAQDEAEAAEAVAEKEPVEVPPEEEPIPEPEPPVEKLPERFDVAKAPLVPPSTQDFPQESQSRKSKGASVKGPLSFAANEHELAQYMDHVQHRVELVWRSVLRFRYTGTQQASAVLECSISPSGRIASVKISNPGESPIYAALCKEAIEKAGPFRPFPFEVPEMYRSENLQVSWTFTFK
jgi:hypothetical protein